MTLSDSFSSDSIHQAGSLAEKNARSQESRPPADSATVQGFSEGSQGPNEAQLRAFFESSPSLQGEPGNGVEQDPMMQMLQGFLGAAQSNIGAANSPPLGLSPNLAAMMGNPNGAAAPASIQHPETTMKESLIWKIIHAATAFSLGLYVIASSNTLGKSLIRIKGRSHDDELRTKDGTNLFWAFATVELILQSTRYFLQKGRTSSGFGGVMTTVIAFLPEPWAGYLRLAAQYSGIWTTTVGKCS